MNHELIAPDRCTGCGACASACERGAVAMEQDRLGFLKPTIDEVKCTDCGVCAALCPELHPVVRRKAKRCLAAQATRCVRLRSSSGGIFPLLARQTLNAGGTVCGAVWNGLTSVNHVLAETWEQVEKMRGSKYLQSDLTGCYEKIRRCLDSGREVLFTGTPCQAAALRSWLGKEYDNLIIVDFLCMGIPSQAMFQEAVETMYPKESVREIRFRDKEFSNSWTGYVLTALTNDGGVYQTTVENNAYEAGFHGGIIWRDCCYTCPYAATDRAGDITLGDFWGVEAYHPELNDHTGTSLILINTERGAKALHGIESQLDLLQDVPISVAVKGGQRLTGRPVEKTLLRRRFEALLEKHGLYSAMDYAAFQKYDIGIVGPWSIENYGSNLSYYALYCTLSDMGLEPLMIERPADAPWKPNEKPTGFRENPYPEWALSPIFATRNEMRALNRRCNKFLLGSDQLFYHDLYESLGRFATLDYIDSNHIKVAYAASVGRAIFEGNDRQRAEISFFLRDFDAVSVREQDAVELFSKDFGVEAQYVLDPVLLCDREHYVPLAEKGSQSSASPYIAVYMLEVTEENKTALDVISGILGIPYILIGDAVKQRKTASTAIASNEDWLRFIMECEFFVTDSFHGTCFSLLFHKPFLTVVNQYRGSSRFTSLAETFGLKDRMVDSLNNLELVKTIVEESIDFDRIDLTLRTEKERSRQWLKTAIGAKKKKPLAAYNLADERISGLENRFSDVSERSLNNEKWLANMHQRVNTLEGLYGRVDQLEGLYGRVDQLEGLY
ncbi:MAG: 4Fe-4S dicluster domain-containing protein, partial [Ruminococcaceae bacterium]|nr:4Fe-4S dicluster domain-containing protein [Oscillospiraceae bacterium]